MDVEINDIWNLKRNLCDLALEKINSLNGNTYQKQSVMNMVITIEDDVIKLVNYLNALKEQK